MFYDAVTFMFVHYTKSLTKFPFEYSLMKSMLLLQVRRNIRPYFQQSSKHIMFYDAVTFMFVRFTNCYLVAPFVILEIVPSLKLLT